MGRSNAHRMAPVGVVPRRRLPALSREFATGPQIRPAQLPQVSQMRLADCQWRVHRRAGSGALRRAMPDRSRLVVARNPRPERLPDQGEALVIPQICWRFERSIGYASASSQARALRFQQQRCQRSGPRCGCSASLTSSSGPKLGDQPSPSTVVAASTCGATTTASRAFRLPATSSRSALSDRAIHDARDPWLRPASAARAPAYRPREALRLAAHRSHPHRNANHRLAPLTRLQARQHRTAIHERRTIALVEAIDLEQQLSDNLRAAA